MQFEETFVAKIRGGITFKKLFSFNSLIGSCLDDQLIPELERKFGVSQQIERSPDNQISIHTKDSNIQLAITEESIAFLCRPVRVHELFDHLNVLFSFLKLITRCLQVENKVSACGVEFTYIIPLVEKKAIEIINNHLKKSTSRIFVFDSEQVTKSCGFHFAVKIDQININMAINSSEENDALLIVVDIKEFSQNKESSVNIEELMTLAHSKFITTVYKKLFSPILKKYHDVINWDMLANNGSKEEEEACQD